jgi:MFS family permease
MVLGNILYALAYKAEWLYLILIGRMVSGMGFTFWMYAKKYCSDARIVGLRRRTTLAGWQVLGQGIGFSLGPFLGGLLSRINFSNPLFNGFTAPGWLMAVCWVIFWILVTTFFQDVPLTPESQAIPLQPVQESADPTPAASDRSLVPHAFHITPKQWAVNATMAWWAMTSFFLLGSWESDIPVFTSSDAPSNPFHFTPFSAGNLIALGGACTIPFLLLNLHYGRRMQDRNTLAIGSAVGMVGLLIAMSIISARKVNYGSFFVAWFLVALGFNVTSTVTIALLSKQLPSEWNGRISLFIQWSNYTGRVTGAVWGGAGVKVGMTSYVGLQIAYVGLGSILCAALWHHLKAKTG